LRDWAVLAGERFADPRFSRTLKDRIDFADEGETFAGWEFMFPMVSSLEGSVFDYLSDCVFVIDEPITIEQSLSAFYENTDARYAAITEADEIGLEPRELFLQAGELRDKVASAQRIELRSLGKTAAETDEGFRLDGLEAGGSSPLFLFPTAERSVEVEIQSRSVRKFNGDVQAFATEIRSSSERYGEGRRTIVALQTLGMAERLDEILRGYEVYLPADTILVGDLSGGFELPTFDLIGYTEIDIFGEIVRPQAALVNRTRKSKLGAFISDFRDLKAGDYVVHVDHGIGRFDGLQTISSQGAEREFMLLVYADDAKLFVPVERMDLVSRYSSGEATSPALDRLGGIGWQKTKAKAKRAMRDMADELLRLYAERKLVRGHAFSPDAPWQHEFEDAFPFDLTVDQATAIEDGKVDMETAMPMDRLIIGDVGYGKTEVAMRAAFKAVMDGKQ
ncbi:MAG: CarD family transcriptional regulator, partial [Candidatus Binatia bacterium]